MRSVAILLLLAVVARAEVAGASDKDRFDSLIGKFAVDAGSLFSGNFRPRAGCYCASPSAGPAGAGGFVARYDVAGQTYVNCFFPYFKADGSFDTYGYCNEFYLLGK